MPRPSIYFDYNATAPTLPEVAEAVGQVLLEGGNPSSIHERGRRARARVEEARRKVAALLGASPKDVIFTGGGTEANDLGIKGMIAAGSIERLIVCAAEHPSVLDLANTCGVDVEVLAVDGQGLVNETALAAMLESPKKTLAGKTLAEKTLVCVMLANNETGVIQPIKALARVAHDHGALFHTDAIQAAGKIDVDFKDLGVDLLSISAHKFAGPQGVGALVLKGGLDVSPQTHGGGQELGRRSGTENVAGIVGLGVAAEAAQKKLEGKISPEGLRDKLEAALAIAAPEAVFIGASVPRLPNTCLVALPGVAADAQVIQMDLAGYAVSSGSACSSGKVSRSHVLDAMDIGEALAGSAMRISLGWATVESDLPGLLDAWTKMRNRLSQGAELQSGAQASPVKQEKGTVRVASR